MKTNSCEAKNLRYLWAMKKQLLLTLSLAALLAVSCGKEFESPGGRLTAVRDGQTLSVFHHAGTGAGKVLAAQLHIGLVTAEADLDSALTFIGTADRRKINDDYGMKTGKRSRCHNEATQWTLRFRNPDGQRLDAVLRLYDDGAALCYQLPDGTETLEDRTAWHIPDGTRRWIASLKTDYEGYYPLATDGQGTPERFRRGVVSQAWGFPALIEPADGVFALLCEADLRHGDSAASLDNGADREWYRVKLTGPARFADGRSPWRAAIIGTLSDVVESTLVTDLSTPKSDEMDWVEPGVSSWVYWAYNHGSKDFQINRDFIDLAVKMNWPYCLIDWEWPEMENGGDIADVLSYAKDKGVRINLWYNSGTSWVGDGAPQPQDRMNDPERREKELAWLESLGVSGIKVDFFLPDDATMVDYYLDILEDAAKHHLLVDFHGCTIPRGWQRTWPNLMSMESVLGAEWYNNGPFLTPRAAGHNATLPFTRNVIGPMDYTPGTFSDSQFPHITTYAHELALPILFESGLQHMPDRPEAYAGLPAEVRELLSGLPAAWDDTRLLAGYPGEYAVLARRKGDRWYIAGINGREEAADITFPTERLTGAPAAFRLFGDGDEDRSFRIGTATPDGGAMTIPCHARGGFVLVSE